MTPERDATDVLAAHRLRSVGGMTGRLDGCSCAKYGYRHLSSAFDHAAHVAAALAAAGLLRARDDEEGELTLTAAEATQLDNALDAPARVVPGLAALRDKSELP